MNQATPARAEGSPAKLAGSTLRSWATGHRGLIALALIAAAAGAYFNWAWLVATGAAPVILAILPCAALCALGMCHRKSEGTADCCDIQVQRRMAERRQAHAEARQDGPASVK